MVLIKKECICEPVENLIKEETTCTRAYLKLSKRILIIKTWCICMNEKKVAWPGACPTKWKLNTMVLLRNQTATRPAITWCQQSYHVMSTNQLFQGTHFFIINPIFELSLESKFPKLLIIFEIEAHDCLIFDHFRFISKENLTKFLIWGSRNAGKVAVVFEIWGFGGSIMKLLIKNVWI